MKGGGKKTLCFFLLAASLLALSEEAQAVTADIIHKMNSADGSTSVQFQDNTGKNLSMIDSKGNAVIFGSATVINGGLTTPAVVSTGPINMLPSSGIQAAQVNSNGIVSFSSVSVNTLGSGGLASLYSDSNGVMASTSTARFPNLFSSYIPIRIAQQACGAACSVTQGFSDVDIVPNSYSPSGNLSVRVLERFTNIATNNWPTIKLYDGTQGAIVVNTGYQNPNSGNYDSGWTNYNATSAGSQHDWYVIISFDGSGTVTINELVVLVRPAQ